MKKVERSIAINAPVEKVFNYVTNPMKQIDWMPSMMDVKDVTGSGVGQSHQWAYKMAGMLFKGESITTEYISNERVTTKSKGGITSTFTFDFQTLENGTKLDMGIEYEIPVPVVGKIAEKILLKRNEREADLAMTNIKEAMEG